MRGKSSPFTRAVYDQFARVGKALSSGPRLELLDLLCQGPRTVEALAREAGLSVANTSHHLHVLLGCRLVAAEKRRVSITYRLADDQVCSFFQAFRRLAESRVLEIEEMTRRYLKDRGSMNLLYREDLVSQVRNGEVNLLDVRPGEEYRAGHIPGALSVPLDELEQRLAELPRDGEVVAYCRGPYCVLAVEAVRLLRRHGFNAVRLEEGVPEWRERGLPVSVGGLP
jgi:rhodanese-related sulfurtransferase/DNA-binding transcriptional ArsR family regulator